MVTTRMRRFRVPMLAALCGAAAPAAAQLTVGPNINISKQIGDQAQGAIAINPTNPQNLFCVYTNLGPGNGMFGGVSQSGGTLWATRAIGTGADGLTLSAGYSSCAFDGFGNLYLGHLTGTLSAQVGRSINGGTTFTTLHTFTGAANEVTVTTGPSNSAGRETVWVAFTQVGQLVSGIDVTGRGMVVGAFSPPVLAPGSTVGITGGYADICAGPGGRVALAYQNTGSGQGPDNIYLNVDPDGRGAATFGPRTIVTPTNVGGFDLIPAQSSRSINAAVGIDFDRSGGPFNGRLYALYTDETPNESSDTDILLRVSNNNGTTWGAPLRLNNDATTRSQFLPRIAVDRVTGHIAVAWYDCRNDAGNIQARVFGTASRDGGATWLPNVQISAGTSTAAGGSTFDFGDFVGLAIYNDAFYVIWADNSNSTGDNPNGSMNAMDVYVARVTIPAAACYANCDGSTAPPALNINDFSCFLNLFAAGDTRANCDQSTSPPVLNVNDFSCFLNAFAAGCP